MSAALTWDDVVQIARTLPEVETSVSYGTPSLKLRRRFLSRLREDGETIVLRVHPEERRMLLDAEPDKFFITPHYRNYPTMLVRLANVDRNELREQLIDAWLLCAPRGLRAQHGPRLVAEARAAREAAQAD